ncbi:MAG TPA: hypothetical protein VKZ65_01030 [Glycomyces sp.]|nr:hypothetical protein [Glycomyces sp.]
MKPPFPAPTSARSSSWEACDGAAPRHPRHALPLAVATAAVLALGALAVAAWRPWHDSPEAVVDAYMGILQDSFENDAVESFFPRARPYLCADSQAALDRRFDEHGGAGMDRFTYEMLNDMAFTIDYELLESSSEGGSSSVKVRLRGASTMPGEAAVPIDGTLSVELVREDGRWRICDDGLPGM